MSRHGASQDAELPSQHVDLQGDATRYGRGEAHLTFDLQSGDVVVYQTGTWYVDGVAVGPGDDPSWSYALVDGLQVVWTHNCEHGVVRGWHLDLSVPDESGMTAVLRRRDNDDGQGGEEVEFGPEQVIGRIKNVQWDDDMSIGTAPIPLNDDIWRRAAEDQY
jgi:ribosomal protein L27